MSEQPHRHATLAAGIPLGSALLWGIAGLADGGLAPLLVAVVSGALVGAPLAQKLWRRAEKYDDRVAALHLSERVCAALVVAGLLAIVAPDTSWGTTIGLVAIVAASVVPRLRRGLAIPLAFLGVGAALTALPASPWTLLQPGWSGWPSWLAMSYGTGFLLCGSGTGAWSSHTAAVPGFRRGPWLSLGISSLVLLGSAVVWSAAYEGGQGSLGTLAGPLPWILGAAACVGWAEQNTPLDSGQLLATCLAFVWLNSAYAPADALFWPVLLCAPGLLGACLLVAEGPGQERLTSAVPIVLGGVVFAIAWPGFGASAFAASAAMVPLLLILWTGGTRLMVRST